MIGFKRDWQTNVEAATEFTEILRDSLEMGYGVILMRHFEKIDWSLKRFVSPNSMIKIQSEMQEKTELSSNELEPMSPQKSLKFR